MGGVWSSAAKSTPALAQTWTDAVNMLSFTTNRIQLLYFDSENPEQDDKIASAVSPLFASAEVERILLSTYRWHSSFFRLCKAVSSNPTVSTLFIDELQDETLQSEHRLAPTLASVLRSAKTLRKLKMQILRLSRGALKTLAELVDQRPDIEVSVRLYQGDEALTAPLVNEALIRIRSLHKLRIRRIHIDAAAFGNALKTDLRNLQSLLLKQVTLGAGDAKALGEGICGIACGLRTLSLKTSGLDDSGIAAIVEGLLRGYARAPGKSGALRKLILSDSHISSFGMIKVAQLVKANPHLKYIDLSPHIAGPAGYALGEALQACATTLRELSLGMCGLDAAAIIAICRSLSRSSSLSVLDISGSQLKGAGEAMSAVGHDLLAGNGSLEELHISGSNIDGSGMKMLAEGLAMNRSLKILSLGGNEEAEVAGTLGAMLPVGLKELHLSNCNIDDVGGEAVGRFIVLSSSLRELDLVSNKFHAAGARAISQAAAQSCSLESLSLGHNELGDKGAKCIAEWVIGKSKTVRQLHIRSIGMGVEGAKAVAKAVEGKTAVKMINVGEDKDPRGVVFNVMVSTKKRVEKSVYIDIW